MHENAIWGVLMFCSEILFEGLNINKLKDPMFFDIIICLELSFLQSYLGGSPWLKNML
jgi:hypothetical protein